MSSKWNLLRVGLLAIGHSLARAGLIDRKRVVRTTDLAWPRIVTGITRLSKSAADIAMVGIALGPAAIAGVGFATPYWGLAFVSGGGIGDGVIGLIAQHYSTGRTNEIDQLIKTSSLLALIITLPLTALFWFVPEQLIALIGSGAEAIEYGARYLRLIGLAMPFAALNYVGGRTLVGADDAWTPMVIRASGAIVNIALNAVLIFVFDLGVLGAAIGTLLGDLFVTIAFAYGFISGELPFVGEFPVVIDPWGSYFDIDLLSQLIEIATPLALANFAWSGGQFPLLAIVGLFGPEVVAAFVIALRVRDLMDTPGWGFGLASSSLVGQALGVSEENEAEAYAHDIFRFTITVYLLVVVVVFVFAKPVGVVFVGDPTILPLVTLFVRVICFNALLWGIAAGTTGPLRASGDTQWPFYAYTLGLFAFAIPLAYLGAVTSLGTTGLYLALIAEGAIPAFVIYYRFWTGRWKTISRKHRPVPIDR